MKNYTFLLALLIIVAHSFFGPNLAAQFTDAEINIMASEFVVLK